MSTEAPPNLVVNDETAPSSPPAPVPVAPPPAKSEIVAKQEHSELDNSVGIQTIPRKFLFKDVDAMMSEGYGYPTTNNSTICDIVAMYLKGQKILYTEAKTVCEVRLHYLMLPAILITASAAILSMILKDTENGAMIVSILNGVNTFLLTLINYLKLDARAEAHRTSAYKFDKLQSYMEFSSGRILFDTEASLKLAEILQSVEKDVREIKETNQFILPEKIRYEFPKLYSINVFSEVKRIMNQEALHVDMIKECMNKIMALEAPFEKVGKSVDAATQASIDALEVKRQSEIKQVLLLKNVYLAIDQKFEAELELHREKRKYRLHFCGWLKS